MRRAKSNLVASAIVAGFVAIVAVAHAGDTTPVATTAPAASTASSSATRPNAPARARGPRTASEIVGHPVAGAGAANMTVLVNVAVIRAHPVGARLGATFAALPAWAGAIGTISNGSPSADGGAPAVDPLGLVDWIVLYGPSVVHTDRAVVIVRSSLPDAALDGAIATMAKSSTRGGSFDTGAPGVVAVRTYADNAERVIMRVKPGVVIVAPPDKAADIAQAERRATFPARVRAGEAFRMIVKEPARYVAMGNGSFPAGMSELRLWVDAHDDGGADIWIEGDCDTHEHAEDARNFFADTISRQNSILVRMATRGLLNNATVETAGTTMKLHVPASRDQVDAVVALLEANVGAPGRP